MEAPYEKDKPLLRRLCCSALAAAEQGDAELLRAYLADDCTFHLPNGNALSKQEFLAAVANSGMHIAGIAHPAVDVRISFDGSQAQITCRTDAEESGTDALQLEIAAAKREGSWRATAVHVAAR